MSLELICELWEGRISDELEPGELPICHSPFDLRAMGRGIERQRRLFLLIDSGIVELGCFVSPFLMN